MNTTLNNRGEQWVHEGGVATGTIINRDGYQSVKSGGLATGTIINTGAEGGPDSDNSYTGQKVQWNSRIHHHQQKWTADYLIFRASP